MTLRRFAAPIARAFALAAITCSATHHALAESAPGPGVCGPYRELAELLRQRYGETLRWRADENRGFALEFFAQADGTWTLLMRRDEQACAIAAGQAWRTAPEGAF